MARPKTSKYNNAIFIRLSDQNDTVIKKLCRKKTPTGSHLSKTEAINRMITYISGSKHLDRILTTHAETRDAI